MTNSPSSPPPTLPDFIFLLSDHTTRVLACDVAAKLSENDNSVRVEDFLYPIHEAVQMWAQDEDWSADWGDPRKIPAGRQDDVNSLEEWFNSYHGEAKLGEMAWAEAENVLVDVRQIYRDATWTHIKPFLAELKPHQWLAVAMSPQFKMIDSNTASRILFPSVYDVDTIVAAILEASI